MFVSVSVSGSVNAPLMSFWKQEVCKNRQDVSKTKVFINHSGSIRSAFYLCSANSIGIGHTSAHMSVGVAFLKVICKYLSSVLLDPSSHSFT